MATLKVVRKGKKRPTSASGSASEMREVIWDVFDRIGGEPAFAQWAMDNPTDYYKAAMAMMRAKEDAADSEPINVIERHIFRTGIETVWKPPVDDGDD